ARADGRAAACERGEGRKALAEKPEAAIDRGRFAGARGIYRAAAAPVPPAARALRIGQYANGFRVPCCVPGGTGKAGGRIRSFVPPAPVPDGTPWRTGWSSDRLADE